MGAKQCASATAVGTPDKTVARTIVNYKTGPWSLQCFGMDDHTMFKLCADRRYQWF